VSDVHLIKAGDKVGASEAALLGKLGVKPFKYGLEVVKVYDSGSLFEPAVLEITGAWLVLYDMVEVVTRLQDQGVRQRRPVLARCARDHRCGVYGTQEAGRAGRLAAMAGWKIVALGPHHHTCLALMRPSDSYLL
jgi:hypothetical protein